MRNIYYSCSQISGGIPMLSAHIPRMFRGEEIPQWPVTHESHPRRKSKRPRGSGSESRAAGHEWHQASPGRADWEVPRNLVGNLSENHGNSLEIWQNPRKIMVKTRKWSLGVGKRFELPRLIKGTWWHPYCVYHTWKQVGGKAAGPHGQRKEWYKVVRRYTRWCPRSYNLLTTMNICERYIPWTQTYFFLF